MTKGVRQSTNFRTLKSLVLWCRILYSFCNLNSKCFSKKITEVARTRLREEGSRYRSFWPCLLSVYRNEGRRGLYRGLVTQLIRQIPNTAVMMSTYELTVHFLTLWLKNPGSKNGGGAKGSEETLLCKSSHSLAFFKYGL